MNQKLREAIKIEKTDEDSPSIVVVYIPTLSPAYHGAGVLNPYSNKRIIIIRKRFKHCDLYRLL